MSMSEIIRSAPGGQLVQDVRPVRTPPDRARPTRGIPPMEHRELSAEEVRTLEHPLFRAVRQDR